MTMDRLTGSGGGGSGKGATGGQQRTPTTSKDNLDSRAYAKVVDLLCEGEIEGLKNGAKSIFLNNTPLQNSNNTFNFENFTWFERKGTQSQAFLPGFNEILNEVPVNVTVTQLTSITRTVTRQSVDAVRVTISVPQLQRIKDNGDVVGERIQLEIDTQTNGGSYSTKVSDEIRGRTGDLYQRTFLVPITGPFPVNIRVRRLTADSSDPKVNNAFSWSSYTEITYQKLTYPNSALIGLRVDAEQFNSIPSRSYLIRGLKVRIPSNATVDSATGALIYAGIWNGTFQAAQWTSDPAWCLFDLLTSTRYGFGNYLSEATLDKFQFYQLSVYCSALNTRTSGTTNNYHPTTGRHGIPDGLGNFEPRFSCNVNIQTAEDAYNLINQMCSVFRAMPYWSVGALTLAQDAPQFPQYLFSLSNVTQEGFTYSGSSQKTRATVAVVKYFDNNLRDFAYEVVEDQSGIAKYGVLTKEVEAFACTSRGQAHRVGEWLLYTELRETEVVSFTGTIEAGVIVRPGQVISIADPVRSGARRGGRIKSATASAVTVDSGSGLTLGTDPLLSVILPSGVLEQRTVVSIIGNVISVTPAFSAVPNTNAPWLFQNSTIRPTTWRVLSVQEQDGSNYLINALQHDNSKYAFIERGAPLEARSITLLNSIPSPPTGLSFREDLYTYQNTVLSKLTAQWIAVDGVSGYEVQWRKDNGNWNIVRVPTALHEIPETTPGFFEYRIYSLNAADLASTTFLAGSFEALGRSAVPSDVQGFRASLDKDIGVTLFWDKNPDLDIQGYEIWQGDGWGSGVKVGLFQTTSVKIGSLPSGTSTWWIKALDSSELYSDGAASATVVIQAPPAPPLTGEFRGPDVELRWNTVSGSLSTNFYEVRYGDTFATAVVAGSVQGTVFTTKASWVGNRRWFVAAVDLTGNYGAPGTWDGVVIAPGQPEITQQVIDNNVLLQWSDSTQTLPVDVYELRKGSTWATAVTIGTKQGRFTSVFETSGGVYTYWLAAIDSAGNYGTPGSVSAVVNQPPDYQLQMDMNSTLDGIRQNAVISERVLYAAIDPTETWQSHFTSRGWNTLQDQVSAGFSSYFMPSATSGSYTEIVDAGTVLTGSKVTAAITSQPVVGNVSIVPSLSVRRLITDPWTVYSGVSSVFATDFRYVRVSYSFSSSGNDDLAAISAINVRIDAKLINDFGTATANAADTGGTTVTFNVSFIDVQSISVTALTTTPVIAVYDFVDAPNPTSFKVLLFNTSGTRVSGTFSWNARGV